MVTPVLYVSKLAIYPWVVYKSSICTDDASDKSTVMQRANEVQQKGLSEDPVHVSGDPQQQIRRRMQEHRQQIWLPCEPQQSSQLQAGNCYHIYTG